MATNNKIIYLIELTLGDRAVDVFRSVIGDANARDPDNNLYTPFSSHNPAGENQGGIVTNIGEFAHSMALENKPFNISIDITNPDVRNAILNRTYLRKRARIMRLINPALISGEYNTVPNPLNPLQNANYGNLQIIRDGLIDTHSDGEGNQVVLTISSKMLLLNRDRLTQTYASSSSQCARILAQPQFSGLDEEDCASLDTFFDRVGGGYDQIALGPHTADENDAFRESESLGTRAPLPIVSGTASIENGIITNGSNVWPNQVFSSYGNAASVSYKTGIFGGDYQYGYAAGSNYHDTSLNIPGVLGSQNYVGEFLSAQFGPRRVKSKWFLNGTGALSCSLSAVVRTWPNWSSSERYTAGDTVRYGSSAYQWINNSPGNNQPPSDDWQSLGQASTITTRFAQWSEAVAFGPIDNLICHYQGPGRGFPQDIQVLARGGPDYTRTPITVGGKYIGFIEAWRGVYPTVNATTPAPNSDFTITRGIGLDPSYNISLNGRLPFAYIRLGGDPPIQNNGTLTLLDASDNPIGTINYSRFSGGTVRLLGGPSSLRDRIARTGQNGEPAITRVRIIPRSALIDFRNNTTDQNVYVDDPRKGWDSLTLRPFDSSVELSTGAINRRGAYRGYIMRGHNPWAETDRGYGVCWVRFTMSASCYLFAQEQEERTFPKFSYTAQANPSVNGSYGSGSGIYGYIANSSYGPGSDFADLADDNALSVGTASFLRGNSNYWRDQRNTNIYPAFLSGSPAEKPTHQAVIQSMADTAGFTVYEDIVPYREGKPIKLFVGTTTPDVGNPPIVFRESNSVIQVNSIRSNDVLNTAEGSFPAKVETEEDGVQDGQGSAKVSNGSHLSKDIGITNSGNVDLSFKEVQVTNNGAFKNTQDERELCERLHLEIERSRIGAQGITISTDAFEAFNVRLGQVVSVVYKKYWPDVAGTEQPQLFRVVSITDDTRGRVTLECQFFHPYIYAGRTNPNGISPPATHGHINHITGRPISTCEIDLPTGSSRTPGAPGEADEEAFPIGARYINSRTGSTDGNTSIFVNGQRGDLINDPLDSESPTLSNTTDYINQWAFDPERNPTGWDTFFEEGDNYIIHPLNADDAIDYPTTFEGNFVILTESVWRLDDTLYQRTGSEVTITSQEQLGENAPPGTGWRQFNAPAQESREYRITVEGSSGGPPMPRREEFTFSGTSSDVAEDDFGTRQIGVIEINGLQGANVPSRVSQESLNLQYRSTRAFKITL